MRDSVLRKLNELKALYRRRRVMMSVLSVLVCGVLLGTSYLLIQPAVTMTSETHCGQAEHVHSAECYDRELACPLAEHVHGEGCYDEDGVLVCAQEEHTHGEECYESTLTCTVAEHTHTLACYSDPTAVETEDDIAAYLDGLEPSGDWGADTAAVAGAMVGYAESEANYEVLDDGVTVRGYTFFGDCAGTPYADWNTLFADFCLDMAEVGEDVFPRETDAAAWVAALTAAGYYTDDISDVSVGDLAFMDADDDGAADRVGIVTAIDGEALTLAEGDIDNAVAEERYSASDILGYGMVTACWQCSDVVGQIDALTENCTLGNSWEGGDGDSDNGSAVVSKQIKVNADGSFTLRLSAYVTGAEVVTYTYSPVDVVLIVDTSSSMHDVNYKDATTSEGNNQYRIDALKEAATTFVDKIAKYSPTGTYTEGAAAGMDKASRIAIVEFNYWRELKWTGSGSQTGGTKTVVGLTSVEHLADTDTAAEKNTDLHNSISGLTAKQDSSTETWEGFNVAYNILYNTNDTIGQQEGRKKVVVFFTDGEPEDRIDGFGWSDGTSSYKSASTTYVDPYKNHDQFSEYENVNRALENAMKLKNQGAYIYSVGVATQSKSSSFSYSTVEAFLDAISSNNPKGGATALFDLTTNGKYYTQSTTKGYNAPSTTKVKYPYNTSSLLYTAKTGTANQYRYTSQTMGNLTVVFDSVVESIVKLSMDLDEKTILKDIISDEFTMNGDQTAQIVQIYTQRPVESTVSEAADGTVTVGQWQDPVSITDKTAAGLQSHENPSFTVSQLAEVPNDPNTHYTVKVTGFDYSEHWIGFSTTSGTKTLNPNSMRLVVDIQILSTHETSGDTINSNLPGSGIYADENTPVSDFPFPEVPFPCYADIELMGTPASVELDLSGNSTGDGTDGAATFRLPYQTTEGVYQNNAQLDWDLVKTDSRWGDAHTLTVNPVSTGGTLLSDQVRAYAKSGQQYTVTCTIPEGYTAHYDIYTENGTAVVSDGVAAQGAKVSVDTQNNVISMDTDQYYRVVIQLQRDPVFSFTKRLGTAETSSALQGIAFTVTHDYENCEVDAADDEAFKGITYTAVSDENGTVTFDQLVPGHTYLMTETVPADKVAAYSQYRVVAGAEGYTVTPLDEGGEPVSGYTWNSVIYNQNKEIKITVNTVVTDSGKFPYTITYTPSGGTETTVTEVTYNGNTANPADKFGNGDSYSFIVPYGAAVKIQTDQYDGYHLSVAKGDKAILGDTVTLDKAEVDTEYTFTFTAGYELPHTGGTGTILYTTIGGLLTSAALAGFMLRRRRERRAE